jgi:hypothetical protein
MSRGKEGRQDGGLGADQPVADAAGLRGSQPTQRLHPEMPARWFPMPGWNVAGSMGRRPFSC